MLDLRRSDGLHFGRDWPWARHGGPLRTVEKGIEGRAGHGGKKKLPLRAIVSIINVSIWSDGVSLGWPPSSSTTCIYRIVLFHKTWKVNTHVWFWKIFTVPTYLSFLFFSFEQSRSREAIFPGSCVSLDKSGTFTEKECYSVENIASDTQVHGLCAYRDTEDKCSFPFRYKAVAC